MTAPNTVVEFLPLGALIQSFFVGDRNIVLGFPNEKLYEAYNKPYFGVTVGRVANRIKNAKIDSLNNTTYLLEANDGLNSSHGGPDGWSRRSWDGPTRVATHRIESLPEHEGSESVQFRLVSGDGDQGFPGEVEAIVTYTTATATRPSGGRITTLAIEYEARLLSGADETVVNLTNHSYFNLSGLATIEGHEIKLSTELHLPVDEHCIPNGAPIPYAEQKVTEIMVLGPDKPVFNHCFIEIPNPSSIPLDTRLGPLRRHLYAFHPTTELHLEVLSTEPSFQVYTGDYNDVPAVGGNPAQGRRSGFCCEPSRYVNSVNVPEWRNMTVLRKGQVYGSRLEFRAWEGRRDQL